MSAEEIAAIPLPVTSASSAPSSEAIRWWSTAWLGLFESRR